jgi:hypothetical protein
MGQLVKGQLVEDRSRWLSNGTEPPPLQFSPSPQSGQLVHRLAQEPSIFWSPSIMKYSATSPPLET